MAEQIGWILVHSKKVYGGGKDYETPQDELRDVKNLATFNWNWNWPNPLKPGGPYLLLFSWEGEIFGDSAADVSADFDGGDEYVDYNFSFDVRGFKWRKPVTFDELDIHPPYHSLITVTPEILRAYQKRLNRKR